MTDRLPGLHLQRRAGRRKSTPASPTSPTFQRRYGRSQDSDLPVLTPPDPKSGNTPNDSPSIDLTMPSPTFDLATISPALTVNNNAFSRSQPPNRASDEFGKSRYMATADTTRPATSSATGQMPYSTYNRGMASPEPTSSRGSPVVGNQRTSVDVQRRPPSREEEASVHRAAAFWSQYDKNTNDETGTRGLNNSKKSRFNLLNPMSLLARRRSSQNTNKLDENNVNSSSLHVPAIPDNIEPSIRGSIVHDFSAPRARRMNSDQSPRPGPAPSPSYPRRPSEMIPPAIDHSVGTPASLHSPMFREHFQEEKQPIQPANTAYLHGQNLQVPVNASLPTFAKNLPLILPTNEGSEAMSDEVPNFEHDGKKKMDATPPEPELPPPPPPKQAIAPVPELPQLSNLPKHMTSTSSRFSFLGQQGSIAQEKVLEEKHKEHALKNPAPVRLSVASVDDVDDYDVYDDFDEEDGFDNGDITIKNVDLPSSQLPEQASSFEQEDYDIEDDDEFGTGDIVVKNIDMPSSYDSRTNGQGYEEDEVETAKSPDIQSNKRQSLQAFHFTPQSLLYSPTTTQHTSQPTPRDVEGFPIGTAEFGEGMSYSLLPKIRDSRDLSESAFYEGLGISTTQPKDSSFAEAQALQGHEPFDDSDLYFDDGEFGDELGEPGDAFNEEDLDDPQQIRDIPAENARRYEEAQHRNMPTEIVKAQPQPVPQNSFLRSESPNASYKDAMVENQAGLTEDNLAAYHDALATAATKAAADGKFNRSVSFIQVSDDETDSPFHNSMPGVSSRGSRYSNNMISSGISDEEGFGFEDDMDDEAMIAAANADALENDDDGIYGQEFGFYARTYGRTSADFVNGGYFASSGSNGIKRSHSGKNNFQEPSLTPITERSEWSTRNSVASLPLHTGIPGFGQSLPSPGIAQLLDRDSPIVDDEMSMSTLMKLRGRAFGGSSTSINSLTERHHQHSSPLAHPPGHNMSFGDSSTGTKSSPAAHRSGRSIAESEDEDDETGRHTLTQNTPHKKLLHTNLPTRDTSNSSQEHTLSSPMRRKGNHSRNSSGAESVSYERDEDGRWVLERRWTGDDGELEVIDREYLAGMRI